MTVLGQHTGRELLWLVQSRDYFGDEVERRAYPFMTPWRAKDAPVAEQWIRDWAAFAARYETARASAQALLDAAAALGPAGVDVIPAEPQWTGIVRAFQPVENTKSPGDFSDLVARLRAAGCPVAFPQMPTDPSIDWDLATYKSADDALRAVERATKTTATGLGWLVLGLGAAFALGAGLSRGRR